jgi:hypothetical protein
VPEAFDDRTALDTIVGVTADGTGGPHDVAESMLELRDQVLGVQAQLDELDARMTALEHRLGHTTRGAMARVRSSARRLRGSVGGRTPPPA